MSKVMSDHQESELFTYDRTWEEIELMLDKSRKKAKPMVDEIA